MAFPASATESSAMSHTLTLVDGEGHGHGGRCSWCRMCVVHPIFRCIFCLIIMGNILIKLIRIDGLPIFAAILITISIVPVSVIIYLACRFIYKKLCRRSTSYFLVVAVPGHPPAVTLINELPPGNGARFIIFEDPLPCHGTMADSESPPVPKPQDDLPPSYTEVVPPPYSEGEPPPYPEGKPPPYTEEELPPLDLPHLHSGSIRLPLVNPTQEASSIDMQDTVLKH